VEVPEVELRSSIIAGEDLSCVFLLLIISCRVVQDDCVHLVRVVELRSLVLLDDEGQEAGALIFGLAFAYLGLLVPAHLAGFLMDLPGLNALDCELS
jgi:hypothetical protein